MFTPPPRPPPPRPPPPQAFLFFRFVINSRLRTPFSRLESIITIIIMLITIIIIIIFACLSVFSEQYNYTESNQSGHVPEKKRRCVCVCVMMQFNSSLDLTDTGHQNRPTSLCQHSISVHLIITKSNRSLSHAMFLRVQPVPAGLVLSFNRHLMEQVALYKWRSCSL